MTQHHVPCHQRSKLPPITSISTQGICWVSRPRTMRRIRGRTTGKSLSMQVARPAAGAQPHLCPLCSLLVSYNLGSFGALVDCGGLSTASGPLVRSLPRGGSERGALEGGDLHVDAHHTTQRMITLLPLRLTPFSIPWSKSSHRDKKSELRSLQHMTFFKSALVCVSYMDVHRCMQCAVFSRCV